MKTSRCRLMLLCALLAGCKHKPLTGKLDPLNPPPATNDAAAFKIDLATVPNGKHRFFLCDTQQLVKIDEDSGKITLDAVSAAGGTVDVCVSLFGYVNQIGNELDKHTYKLTVMPKPGFEPETIAAAMRKDADAVVTRLANLERQIARSGRVLPATCPADMEAARVGFASTQWVRQVAAAGPEDPDLWVWPGPFERYLDIKDASGRRQVDFRDREGLTKVAAIRYVALIKPRQLVTPTLLGNKFIPGKGNVDLYLGELASGRLLCRTSVEFQSSETITWESSAHADAWNGAPNDVGGSMKREDSYIDSERHQELRSDFHYVAVKALTAAVTRMSPGLRTNALAAAEPR